MKLQVSNSSWANFGYLVAGSIEDEDITLPRLRTLSNLHGIGVIHLTKYAHKSEIIIPATERSEIDWDASNKLAAVNGDFKRYLRSVCVFYKTGRIDLNDWDGGVLKK